MVVNYLLSGMILQVGLGWGKFWFNKEILSNKKIKKLEDFSRVEIFSAYCLGDVWNTSDREKVGYNPFSFEVGYNPFADHLVNSWDFLFGRKPKMGGVPSR